MARGKFITVESTALDALQDAWSEIEELRDEVVEWRDNMESADMTQLPKYEEVSECADTLENSDLERSIEALAEALEVAAAGKPFKAGCPQHVEGQPCPRCGWKGIVGRDRQAPTFQEYDPPKREEWQRSDGSIKVQYVVAIEHDGGSATLWTVPEGADPQAERDAARAQYEERVAKIRERNELTRLGRMLPDEPAVEPHEGIAEAAGETISWHEFRKYGKQALNLSRSDRMGNAVSAMQAAVEHLSEALRELDDDERVREALEAVEQVENDVSEISEIEFPGMFG